MTARKRIAVVGSGVAGLGAAWALKDTHDVVLFEQDDRLGGHANTVEIDHGGTRVVVDTGFIVFNQETYPNFLPFLDALGVESRETTMSFGVSTPAGIEWCSNLNGVFAQKRNFFRPSFLVMLLDMARFNRRAPKDLKAGRLDAVSLADYLRRGRYGRAFIRDYLLPMGAAIWSTSERTMLDYPAASFVRFCNNHRLLHAVRPSWRTVAGGSRAYVAKVAAALGDRVRAGAAVAAVRRDAAGVTLTLASGAAERFDDVILACHSDQALALLADPSADERDHLGAIRYAPNRAVLHRDVALMPKRRRAWAAWNYRVEETDQAPSVTYDMNALQHIPRATPVFVTLNPTRAPRPDTVFAEFDYDHPQFTAAALAAQRTFNRVQGVNRTWFAGAWLGYGFHEDGLRAGLRAALKLGGRIPWDFVEGDIDGGAWPQTVAAEPARAAASA